MSGPTRSAPPSAGSEVAGPTGTDRAALQAALNAGGEVRLREGTYVIDAPLAIPSFASLVGESAATIIQAAPTFAGTALLTLAADATEQVGVRNLTLDGNKANITSGATPHGIYLFNQGTLFPFTHTDAHNRLVDVFIYNVGGDGVRFDSAATSQAQPRETKMRGVTVYRADGHGVYIKIASDLKLVDVVCGNCGLNAFEVDSSGATQMTACKGFGSGQIDAVGAGYGFRLKNGQAQLTGCQAQDNMNHGYKLESQDGLYVGCLADSNGTTAANKAGFRVDFGSNALIGCMAVDRWSGAAKVQAYGYEIGATDFQSNVIDNVIISGGARANITGDVHNLSLGANITVLVNQTKLLPGPVVSIANADAVQAFVGRRHSATQTADLLLLQDEALGTLAKVDKDGVFTNNRTGNGAAAFRASVRGDAQSRYQVGNDGAIQIGIDGTQSPTVRLSKEGLAGQIPRLVMPVGVGANPLVASLSTKGVPTANGARLARVFIPTSGVLTDLAAFVIAAGTSGTDHVNFFVLDTGDAAAGFYTVLAATGSMSFAGTGWQKVIAGSLNINVVAGQQLVFGWSADTFVPTIAHHNIGSTFVNMTALPSGFDVVPGGASPKLAATATAVFGLAAAGTIAEASMLTTNADSIPLIIARVA